MSGQQNRCGKDLGKGARLFILSVRIRKGETEKKWRGRRLLKLAPLTKLK